ncbi:hypothetical protein U1Q18_011707 [Sarracenia purpurea var. burkii]
MPSLFPLLLSVSVFPFLVPVPSPLLPPLSSSPPSFLGYVLMASLGPSPALPVFASRVCRCWVVVGLVVFVGRVVGVVGRWVLLLVLSWWGPGVGLLGSFCCGGCGVVLLGVLSCALGSVLPICLAFVAITPVASFAAFAACAVIRGAVARVVFSLFLPKCVTKLWLAD